jgi:allantoin racemase
MKIWYQSSSSYGYEPVFEEYGKTLEEQCNNIVRPDTEVHVEGIEVMVRDIENQKALQYFQNIQSLNNMLRAEREGYDAFVIGCTLDNAMEEGKSMVDIPVVGISEAGYHLAMMMGNLFAVVTSSSAFFEIYKKLAEKYGVANKYLQGPYIYPASEEEIAMALTDPEPLLKNFKAVAEKAVDDGASVIIPAPAFLTTLALRAGLTTINDALVLDTISVAIKTAEMLVDLKKIGIEPSRRIGVYARPDEKTRKAAFEQLGKVFKIKD